MGNPDRKPASAEGHYNRNFEDLQGRMRPEELCRDEALGSGAAVETGKSLRNKMERLEKDSP
jgi:hypothetical protein